MPVKWPLRTGLGLNVDEDDRGSAGDRGKDADLTSIDLDVSRYRPPSGGSLDGGEAGVVGVCVAGGMDGLESEACV